jgi:hypothetical protein
MPRPGFPEPQFQPGSKLDFPYAWMTRGSHGASWGGQGQRVVERMIVDWQDYAQCNVQPQLCGYAAVDGAGGGNKMHRVTPFPHPAFPWLYVDADVGISDVKPVGPGMKFPYNGQIYVNYTYAILTLLFTERKYAVLEDADVTVEFDRYVSFYDKGSGEFIQLDTGSYAFTYDAITTAKGIQGAKFKSGLALLDAKDNLILLWRLVPHHYLHNIQGIAKNILDALSKVNNDFFLGFQPGTLYFDSHEKEQKSFPIIPGTYTDTWAWDVTLIFKYRNPPHDPFYDKQEQWQSLGHNLAPAPQAGPDGLWYPIASLPFITNNTARGGGAPLFQATDFTKIFTQAE